ncbi:BRCT domain-containing protein [Thauera sp.]|uniref:BRCT domain-containing protein n=1 Tax=Thauera sp. TaxID=1905334 RepID=UPI001B4C7DC3|nr:BRCT domain-containing protein [Thauera sp.]MBP6130881.1 BRCT domain-containing protein [Thauera sp.]MBP7047126.1 BRCT domain-containing protein [Thauera sp.]
MAREPNDYALRRIHADRVVKRQIDELIGLAKGALLDGKVEQHEADGILAWLHGNVECLDTWPASVLYDRLRAMLADGVLDPDEAGELLGLLMQIAAPAGLGAAPAPSTLPLTAPAPEILYPGRSFCFTGVFEFGSRADCHDAVLAHGGEPAKGVTKKLSYLVIGSVGSDFWRHSSFGTKILKAAQYSEEGAGIAIVSEAHWVSRLR